MDPGLLEQYKAYLMCAAQFGNVWKPYWSALSRWVIRCFAHTAQGSSGRRCRPDPKGHEWPAFQKIVEKV